MRKHNRIARSLCAVMLAVSTLMPPPVARAVDPVAEGSAKDVYSLTVEFGSLAFYYDHGIWDPNLMNYVASTTDDTAAEGTTQGFPGWYGFDETANKISVTNTSAFDMTIKVSLSFRQLTGDEVLDLKDEYKTSAPDVDPQPITGVAMTATDGTVEAEYKDYQATWDEDTSADNDYAATVGGTEYANRYITSLPRNYQAVALIQLHGEPQMGGKRYVSENQMAPIGMLELKIEREPTT